MSAIEMTLKIIGPDGYDYKYIEWPTDIRIPVNAEYVWYDGTEYQVDYVSFEFLANNKLENVTLSVRKF